MKKLKMVLSVLLCLILVLPVFISCGKEETGESENPTSVEDVVSDVEDAAEDTKDPDAPDLPEVDMGGKTFTVFTAGWGEGSNLFEDIGAEEITGDPIDDAAYNRRVKIEQEYNCQIRQINVELNAEAMTQYQNVVLAGDTSYDFAMTNCTNFTSLLTGNYLIDFEKLTYVSMDKPYWDESFYESMAVLGKHFAASGDISKRRLECVWIMAFNKSIIAQNAFESPYDLVKSGQWTYGKMHEIAKEAAKDLNGDGVMTLQDDLWGLNYTGDTIMGIINCSGVKIAELDSEGIPQLTVGNEANIEKLLRIYEDMRDHTYSIDTLFKVGGGLTELNDTFVFSENRCLFLACASHNVSTGDDKGETTLRNINVEFGIVPYPKWDAAQIDYTPYTAGNYHPVLTVPKTNDDLENTSIILEALAYEGRKTISPAFYESLLKTKTARDEDSAEMIDFIFGNLSYDVGNMYNFGGICGEFGYNMSTNPRANILSTIERNTNVWQKAIDNIVAEIEKNN